MALYNQSISYNATLVQYDGVYQSLAGQITISATATATDTLTFAVIGSGAITITGRNWRHCLIHNDMIYNIRSKEK